MAEGETATDALDRALHALFSRHAESGHVRARERFQAAKDITQI